MKERLLTKSYCFILAANFLLYFGFYILMPVLAFYLVDTFSIDKGAVGMILACYTVSALMIRPFSGYLLDTFSRKPLYLVAFFIFTIVFGGYVLAGTIAAFVALRIVHGLSFGTVTVSGNTIVIDIMPSSRRGEGLGFYGLSNNMAMALGPMTGLMLHDHYSYDTIFIVAMCCCLAGLFLAMAVKTPKKPLEKNKTPISLDRFILLKGIPVGIDLLLLSVPYGITSSYVAVYAQDIGITVASGLFFTFMAVGMATTRLFAGRLVDRGQIIQVMNVGLVIVTLAYLGLCLCQPLIRFSVDLVNVLFYAVALMHGIGFGMLFPSFNTMFVNLGTNSQRGTATSTYLTSWDVGLGLGFMLGGYVGEVSSFSTAYLIGTGLCLVSMLIFRMKVVPHYIRYRMR